MGGCRQRLVPREKSWPGVTSGRTSGNVRTASLAAVCFWPASYLSLAAAPEEPPEEPQFPMCGVGGRAEFCFSTVGLRTYARLVPES